MLALLSMDEHLAKYAEDRALETCTRSEVESVGVYALFLFIFSAISVHNTSFLRCFLRLWNPKQVAQNTSSQSWQ